MVCNEYNDDNDAVDDDDGYDDDDDADGDDCDYAIRPMEVFSLPQSNILANKQVRHNSL